MGGMILGFLLSWILWVVLVFVALKGALLLHRGNALSERWLLVVPFLLASLIFFGFRYRFSLWFLERRAVHEVGDLLRLLLVHAGRDVHQHQPGLGRTGQIQGLLQVLGLQGFATTRACPSFNAAEKNQVIVPHNYLAS